MRSPAAFLLLLVLSACQGDPPESASAGASLFSGLSWVEGAPDLAGKVVLVRWWTRDCPECSGSAPALSRLGAKAPLVSVYHPKPKGPVTAEEVRAYARKAGMPGILAIDPGWSVLDRWAPPASREATSLTFLIDGHARVRYVHPGGLLGPEDEHHLAQRIEALLTEKY